MAIAGKESCPLREGADTRRALQPTGRAGRDGCPSLLPDFVARGSNYQIANQITLQCKQRSAPGDAKGTWRGWRAARWGGQAGSPRISSPFTVQNQHRPRAGAKKNTNPLLQHQMVLVFWFGGF